MPAASTSRWAPFTAPDRIAVFDVEPQRLSIQTTEGVIVEPRDDPRSSFPPFDLATTRWDPVQVAYFLSAAHWNYLTQPFSFTYPGVETREIQPWDESGETWRRLAVRFPKLTPTTTPISFSITTPISCCAAWTTHPRSPPTRPSRTTPTIPKRLTGWSSRRADVIHRRDADGIADQTVASITLDVANVTVETARRNR